MQKDLEGRLIWGWQANGVSDLVAAQAALDEAMAQAAAAQKAVEQAAARTEAAKADLAKVQRPWSPKVSLSLLGCDSKNLHDLGSNISAC